MDRPFYPLLTRAISVSSDASLTDFSLTDDQRRVATQVAIYNQSASYPMYAVFGSSAVSAAIPAAGSATAGLITVPPASQIMVSASAEFTHGSFIHAAGGSSTAMVMPGRVDK
jgi:hypothetical protein